MGVSVVGVLNACSSTGCCDCVTMYAAIPQALPAAIHSVAAPGALVLCEHVIRLKRLLRQAAAKPVVM